MNSGEILVDQYMKPDRDVPWTNAFVEKINIGVVDNEIFTFEIKMEVAKFYYALVCDAKGIIIDYTLVLDYIGNGYTHENYFKTGNCFDWNADFVKTTQFVSYEVKTEHL